MNRDAPAQQSLSKMLGLAFGLAVTVGNTIGAGILRTPGDIASLLPNALGFIGIWVIGGTYALLGANALAELGTMMPRSGGQYVFAHDIFGDYIGFVVGWMDWISTCASTAAIATVIGESVVGLFGAASGSPAIAMVVIVVFTTLLLGGTKRGDRAQQLTSLLKALVLVGLVVACFAFGGRSTTTAVAPSTAAVSGFVAFLLAAQSVVYAYDGWNGPIYFSEELNDPSRQIPRGMFYGLAGVASIYLLVNLAFLYAVPLSSLAGSKLAAGTVANSIFGSAGERVVQILVIAALPSAVNACILMASRTLFSMSRDGLGIPVASRLSPRGTPMVSLIATGLVALAFIATGTFENMIAIAAFFFVANYATSFLGLIRLRIREPDRPRPYRTVGYPWTTGLVFVGSLAFLVSAVFADPRNSLFALGILVISYPVFRLTRRRPPALVPAE